MDQLKQFVTRRLLSFVLKKLFTALAPYILPLLAVAVVALCFTDLLFDTPKAYDQNHGQMAFFTTRNDPSWNLEKDKHLDKEYHDVVEEGLGSKATQPYTPSQYQQSVQYRLDWSILAALDRILGDPVMNDQVHIKPDPAARYDLLKPNFTWRQATVNVTRQIKDEKGNMSSTTEAYTVQLLDRAETYDASYQFFYRQETTNINGVRVVHEVLDHVQSHVFSMQENRLVKILLANHLTVDDADLVEELAREYLGDTRTHPPVDNGVPLPSAQITNDIKKALQLRGLPADWLAGMQELVMDESSGDPNSYNPTPVWYSSAYGYQHAEGLCQMMPPTFKEHKMAGHNDIWNPLDNLLASLDYIKSAYGSVYNIKGITDGDYGGY